MLGKVYRKDGQLIADRYGNEQEASLLVADYQMNIYKFPREQGVLGYSKHII